MITAAMPRKRQGTRFSPRRCNGYGRPLTRTQARPSRPLREGVAVVAETGPFDAIKGESIFVMADAQNLDIGAMDIGFKLSWRQLGAVLDGVAQKASRHAILSQHPGDDRRLEYLTERGWMPHATEVRQVHTHNGWERKGNADFLMAFLAGVLVSRAQADIVVIASGDGDLVEELALGIRSLPHDRRIVTLSLAGSTAFRLNADTSRLIDANIEIGRDCLHPMTARVKTSFVPPLISMPLDRKENPHAVPTLAS